MCQCVCGLMKAVSPVEQVTQQDVCLCVCGCLWSYESLQGSCQPQLSPSQLDVNLLLSTSVHNCPYLLRELN